jgi:hypothetical protein
VTTPKRPKKPKQKKELPPTGLKVDSLAAQATVTLTDYLGAVSEYVLKEPELGTDSEDRKKKKKAAQVRLSLVLGRVVLAALREKLPDLRGHAGERPVSGALRTQNADVSEFNELDGLRLGIEIKPVNLAVGRAIWNRFGDIRTFAVNLHLKFPFAVIGGILVFPTHELTKKGRRSTRGLVARAVGRLIRAGGRESEAEAAHLLEGICVLLYDPDTATVDVALPPVGSGLRWEEFILAMQTAYDARFGEGIVSSLAAGAGPAATEPVDADAEDEPETDEEEDEG